MIKLRFIKIILGVIIFMQIFIACQKNTKNPVIINKTTKKIDCVLNRYYNRKYIQTFYDSGELKSFILKKINNEKIYSIDYAKDGSVIWQGFYYNEKRAYYDSVDFKYQNFKLKPSFDTLFLKDTIYFKIENSYYHPEELSLVASIANFNYSKDYNSYRLIPIDTGYVRIVVQSFMDYGAWKIIDSIYVSTNQKYSRNISSEIVKY